MPENISNTFYGLPIPNADEAIWLENTYLGHDPSFDVSPRDLASGLLIRNPHINTVIQVDKNDWYLAHSAELAEFETEEALKYISEGYCFVIGALATVGYIRGHYSSKVDFWNNCQERQAIPRFGINTARRVVGFRRGSTSCPIDIGYYDPNGSSLKIVQDSSEIALLDSEQYITKFKGFRRIMEKTLGSYSKYYYVPDYYDQLRPSSRTEVVDKLIKARETGFRHGVMNGIEMFIQAREEELIHDIWPKGRPLAS